MALLYWFQASNPLHPWALALGACLLGCFPRFSRRLAGVLFFTVAVVGTVWVFLDNVFRSFTPSG